MNTETTPTPDIKLLEKEISANYDAFKKMHFHERDKGNFALLRHGELVEIMADKMDAHKLARRLYADGLYSIQEIMPPSHSVYMSPAPC